MTLGVPLAREEAMSRWILIDAGAAALGYAVVSSWADFSRYRRIRAM
jgi:hypothetical protein